MPGGGTAALALPARAPSSRHQTDRKKMSKALGCFAALLAGAGRAIRGSLVGPFLRGAGLRW